MDNSLQNALRTPRQGFFNRFIQGDFGLAKTYWLFGIVVNAVVGLIINTMASMEEAYWLAAAYAVYHCALTVATWNAARRYQGLKLWAILAVLIMVMRLIATIRDVLQLGSA